MAKEKEGKKKNDKTAPMKSAKEKKADKTAKRNEKNGIGKTISSEVFTK